MSTLQVKVAWAFPGTEDEVQLELPEPANVQSAIDAARRLSPALAAIEAGIAATGVWGKVRAPDYLLREGDRVELYRALLADPKAARRANARVSRGKTNKT